MKLKLTNEKKRLEFLRTWQSWPIWAAVPELGLTVRIYELPEREAIVAAEYASTNTKFEKAIPFYQWLYAGAGYLQPYYAVSAHAIASELKKLGHIEVDIPDGEKGEKDAADAH